MSAQGPQRSDAGEAQTQGPSVSSQALYHWATALPVPPPPKSLMSKIKDFLKPDLGPNMGPFPIKKWAKNFQNGEIYSQFLNSILWWAFHENRNKNMSVTDPWKFASFLCKFSKVLWRAIKATNMLQLYTANFDLFKIAAQYQFFPILMVQMLFTNFNRPLVPISER